MLKTIAVSVSILLLAQTAQAQVGGCYVDVTQPGVCWQWPFTCYVSAQDNLYYYGGAVGGLCNRVDSLENQVNYQQGLMAETASRWQADINRANAAEYDRDVALAVNAYQAKLIKKLKKKCGKVCKKVK
jgi:hypothetical protein